MGFFGKPKEKNPVPSPGVFTTPSGLKPYKLDKRIDTVLNEMKTRRAQKCQAMGLDAIRIGQDLRYIEKKIQELYTVAVNDLKTGATISGTFQKLYEEYAVLDVDREILERMFLAR